MVARKKQGSRPEARTSYPAGSPGKIAVLRQRALRGETLFHGRDNRAKIDAKIDREEAAREDADAR